MPKKTPQSPAEQLPVPVELIERRIYLIRGQKVMLSPDLSDIKHPSLHAKKYNEKDDIWQARITRDWRFYFTVVRDTYIIIDVMAHPK
jgi:hypothetical protein